MKKGLFLTIPLSLLAALSACQNTDSPAKVNLTFGKLYDSSKLEHIDDHLVTLTHSGLTSLVNSKKEFVLLVYDKDNTCTCWADFEKTILSFVKMKNALMYAISPSEFDGGHETFGLTISKSEETIAIFEDGKIKEQKVTKGSEDEFMTPAVFSSWMSERVHFSNMLYVSKTQLEGLFAGDIQFTVGFLRASCSDCSYVESSVLSSFNSKDNNISYVIDCDAEGIRNKNGEYDQEQWASFKYEYGLSEDANPDYGYGGGFVPSFYTYAPGDGDKKDLIIDGDVYLNDVVSNESGKYVVTNSFFTEERAPLLNFLGNTMVDHPVFKVFEIEDKDIENGRWNKEAAAKYHDPLLNAFLTAYIGK
ncbi:MAG: hypothetical protein J5627_04195 [Bacilli bacterium]|nr:hypothetical protein [Bacilli bacterium]